MAKWHLQRPVGLLYNSPITKEKVNNVNTYKQINIGYCQLKSSYLPICMMTVTKVNINGYQSLAFKPVHPQQEVLWGSYFAISTDLCFRGAEQHSLQTPCRVGCAAAGSWRALKSVTALPDCSVISSICPDFLLLEKPLEQSQLAGCQHHILNIKTVNARHLVFLPASLQHYSLSCTQISTNTYLDCEHIPLIINVHLHACTS